MDAGLAGGWGQRSAHHFFFTTSRMLTSFIGFSGESGELAAVKGFGTHQEGAGERPERRLALS